jgi:hypothetical protein
VGPGDDQVIEHPNVDQCEGFAQPARNELVGVAGLSDSARGVMGQDHSCGVVPEGFLHDFARVHRCAVDRAAEQVLAGDQSVTVVEVDQREDFVLALRKVPRRSTRK